MYGLCFVFVAIGVVSAGVRASVGDAIAVVVSEGVASQESSVESLV